MSVPLFLEIKSEYTEHLVDTLTPYIYEGLRNIYNEAVKITKETQMEDKTLLVFQKTLQEVPNWNQQKIEEETHRIKQMSHTAEYFDDLVRAVIKSNIILLSYSNDISNVIGQTFYNNFSIPTFIHRCYTECAKDAHNNPYLFYHDVDPMDVKRNQIIIQQNIQSAITRAVRKILPVSMILREFLVNSINIIQEPPKVELLGMPVQNKPVEQTQPSGPGVLNQPDANKPVSEKRVDPKLEKEVMNIIKSENNKTDKDKIKDMMKMDEILSSIKKENPGKHSKPNIPHHLIDKNSQHASISITNRNLSETDKKILNINFDEETTVEKSAKETVSMTNITSVPQANPSKYNVETSERIDPSKVDYIEDYGVQKGGSGKHKKRRH